MKSRQIFSQSCKNSNTICASWKLPTIDQPKIHVLARQEGLSEGPKLIGKKRLNHRYPSGLWIQTWVHGKFEFNPWKYIQFQRNIPVSRWGRGEIRRLERQDFENSKPYLRESMIFHKLPKYIRSIVNHYFWFKQLALVSLSSTAWRRDFARRPKLGLFTSQNVRTMADSI
jgi:hypothetical protein